MYVRPVWAEPLRPAGPAGLLCWCERSVDVGEMDRNAGFSSSSLASIFQSRPVVASMEDGAAVATADDGWMGGYATDRG